MGDQLMALISGLMSPVNDLRAGAEAELGRLKQSHGPALLAGLVSLICDESLARQKETEWARTMGVILLKGITQREAHLWEQLSANEFHIARSQLLALLVRESPLSRVGRLLIITLAALARVSPWDELMACVAQYAESTNEKERHIAFSLLDKLAEYVGSYLTKHIDTVTDFISKSLSEIDRIDVRSQDPATIAGKFATMAAASQACCSLIYEIEETNISDHQLCLLLMQVSRVGKALVDCLVAGELNHYSDVNSLAEEVFTSLNRLAQDRPRAFQLTYHSIASEVIIPICINIPSGGDGDDYNLAVVKAQCLEMGTSLLTDPITLQENLFQENTSQLRLQHLQAVAHLASSVDLSIYSSEAEAIAEFFAADVSGTSIFDEETSEEDQDDNLACVAISTLEAVAAVFEPHELMQAVLQPVWAQVESPAWQARRAVVLLAGVLSEGASSVMIPLLPELITKTLTLANDTHPRVRYTAVRCLVSFVKHLGCTQASENGEDCDEVNDDDTGGGNGEANKHTQNMFRQAFNTIVPRALCAVIEQNQAFSRIVHAAIHACRMYYDPDQCSAVFCELGKGADSNQQELGGGATAEVRFLREQCLLLLGAFAECSKRNSADENAGAGIEMQGVPPLYLVEEAASLLGNLYGTYFGSALSQAVGHAMSMGQSPGSTSSHVDNALGEFSRSVQLLREIVGPLDGADGNAQDAQNPGLPSRQTLGTSTLRCRCLEGLAIVGRSVGRELFRNTAVELLDDLSLAMQRGLDYSDPLASYMCQTAVRLAGILLEEFEPFVNVTVPTIISFIEAEDEVDIALIDEETGASSAGDGNYPNGAAAKVKTDMVYKRGEGMMKVTHNPHQVREKLMACRILYQYICDIPMFLEPYAGRAVRALSDLTTSLVFDEEGALVIGTAVSDLVRMYAEERERQGSDLDDNAYTLMDLVDQLLEDLSAVDEDGFDQSADVLDNLANAINTLALLVV